MADGRHPGDVDQGREGHAGLQSAEQHEMEAVIRQEEEAEEAVDRAEREEEPGRA